MDRDGFRTAVSQDGARTGGFSLQYSAAGDAWAFAMLAADTANAAATRAVSPFPSRTDGWTHLAGVRDASAGRLRLSADGAPVADAMGAARAAGRAFTIGRGKWNGGDADHFPGRIDQVKVRTRDRRRRPRDRVAHIWQGVCLLTEGEHRRTTL